MADAEPSVLRTRPDPGTLPRRALGAADVTAEAFHEGFGEELAEVLNLTSWRAGRDLDQEYRRIEQEVREAVEREDEWQTRVREEVHPQLAHFEKAPKGAGRFEVSLADLQEIHQRLLFPGAVEACDGTCQTHDTVPLTIHQLGVSLVSYNGQQGTWGHRLFRRDLRQQHGDPVGEVLELLARRGQRAAQNHAAPRDALSELARRAIMTYGERAVLVHQSRAVWLLGQGNPAAYELLAGGGSPDFMILSVRLLRELVEQRQKFAFVASEPADRMLLTIGHALRPLEFAVVGRLVDQMTDFLGGLQFRPRVTVDDRWDGHRLTPEQWVLRFRDQIASRVVYGVFRATRLGPAHVFYAHEDHAHEAARVLMADSVLVEHRGFPMLLDLAHDLCKSIYGGGSLSELANAAYAVAGMPFRYSSERMSRDH